MAVSKRTRYEVLRRDGHIESRAARILAEEGTS